MDSNKREFDNLRAGTCPQITDSGILASGQELKRGAVLGLADGKLKLVDKAAADASKEPYAVLAEDTNSTSGDTTCAVYYTGEFNRNALSFAAGTTADDVILAARKIGIFIKING